MFIVAVLALAVVSIGLFLVAVALKSRSVAALNFIICVIAGFPIMPWFPFTLLPPPSDSANEGLRLQWIAGMIWILIFSASVIAGIYALIPKKEREEYKRRKRRRRRRSRTGDGSGGEQDDQSDFTQNGT